MQSELTIIIPTYNEKDNIKPVIDAISNVLAKTCRWEILFIDDDSPDGTTGLIDEIAAGNNQIRCIKRTDRRGRTSACLEGMEMVISPYLCVMDADLQHDENILPVMLSVLKDNDLELVIGSRYVDSGSTGSLPLHRVWVSKLARKIASLILHHQVHDPTSGFFMLRRDFFERIMPQLSGKGLKGFEILLDILASSETSLKFAEIPYNMRERERGESKLDFIVIWEFFLLLIYKILSNKKYQ